MSKNFLFTIIAILALFAAGFGIYYYLNIYQDSTSYTPDAPVAANEDGFICEATNFDIVLLIDSSGSPVDAGIDDDLYSAVDTFIDSLNLSNNRLAIMDKRGWGNYFNTEYSLDKTYLKSEYKTFGFKSGPPCDTFTGCQDDQQVYKNVRTFISSNQRQVQGETVPTVIITFDDGDRSQTPQADEDWNSCNPEQTELTAWQSLEEFGDMYWIRFVTSSTNSCSYWTGDDVMVRGDGRVINYDYQNGDATQNLLDIFKEVFADQCRLPLEIEKTGAVSNANNQKADVNYTLTVTNPNTSDSVDDVYVIDQIPSVLQNISNITPTNGTYDSNSNTIQWYIAQMAPEMSMQLSFSAEILAADYGEFDNISVVYTDDNGNDVADAEEENDRDNQLLNIDPSFEINVDKSSNITQSSSADTINYNINVNNTGDTPYSNLTVTDTLDSKILETQVGDISVTPSTLTASLEGNIITISGVNLGVGESISFTYTVTLPANTEGTYTNVVVVNDQIDEELGRDEEVVTLIDPDVTPADTTGTTTSTTSSTGASTTSSTSTSTGSSSTTGATLPNTSVGDSNSLFIIIGAWWMLIAGYFFLIKPFNRD